MLNIRDDSDIGYTTKCSHIEYPEKLHDYHIFARIHQSELVNSEPKVRVNFRFINRS